MRFIHQWSQIPTSYIYFIMSSIFETGTFKTQQWDTDRHDFLQSAPGLGMFVAVTTYNDEVKHSSISCFWNFSFPNNSYVTYAHKLCKSLQKHSPSSTSFFTCAALIKDSAPRNCLPSTNPQSSWGAEIPYQHPRQASCPPPEAGQRGRQAGDPQGSAGPWPSQNMRSDGPRPAGLSAGTWQPLVCLLSGLLLTEAAE